MASDISLENRIKGAEEALNKAFGVSEQQEGKGTNRFLNEGSLSNIYKEEASRNEITKQFLAMAKSIRNMRSSYLPSDFFLNLEGGFTADVQANIAGKESYENTFMRMLGMPSVGTSEFGLTREDSEIRAGENIKVVDPFTGEVSEKPYEEVRDTILFQRRLSKRERRFLVDNSIYNISSASATDVTGNVISIRNVSSEELVQILGGEANNVAINNGSLTFRGEIVSPIPTKVRREDQFSAFTAILNTESYSEPIPINTSEAEDLLISASDIETQINIQKISEDIWKFAYLLIPPIQDIEISKCINEPDKIVAHPFTNSRSRKVNDNKVRPTLLESIIRIRLDKISGTSSFFPDSEDSSSTGFGLEFSVGDDTEEAKVFADDYGPIEALFILRLRSAISGLAKKLRTDIETVINEMEKAKQIPSKNVAVAGTGNTQEDPGDSNGAARNPETLESSNGINDLKKNDLQKQKLIEDSLMFLLGDNSEVLDLQAQTQRSSSIYDSHMMSGIIDIVDVPRKRINEELNKLTEKRAQTFSGPIEQKIQEIGVIMGTDIGIGTIDLAVFSLALFTLSEESLLGLLSEAQFERIKKGEFSALIPANFEKANSVESINEFTQLIVDGYKAFIQELSEDKRPDEPSDSAT